MIHALPDTKYLNSLLDYCPKTGAGVWKRSISNRAPVGALVKIPSNSSKYARVTIDGKTYFWHRIAYKMYHGHLDDSMIVDHIDGDTTNNAISNLRLVNRSANQKNQKKRKTNTSGYMGVSWQKARNKWEAYITSNGKLYKLGRYDKYDKAVRARKLAEKKFDFHTNHGRAVMV